MKVNERIQALRKYMKQNKIDVYYIPNEDDHLSEEYTADYFKCKSYVSGFSGDYGCTIVTQKEAGLWTDGRYFIAAEDELKGTCVKLFRLAQAGVPSPFQYLIENTPKNGVLGFDGSVVSQRVYEALQRALKQKGAKIQMNVDLAGKVWGKERPKMPEEPIFILPDMYTGESTKQRLTKVRNAMKSRGVDVLILTQLEDPCWLFHVRGNDIECTPVTYAFAMIQQKQATYYIDAKKVNPTVAKELKANQITLRPYDALGTDLKKLKKKVICADEGKLNAKLYAQIPTSNRFVDAPSPISMYRAVKTPVEIKNIRHAHLKDGIAMCKFVYWVKKNVGKIPMSEISVADHLYGLRAQQDDYIEPSFPTIAGYKANAAMMHYSASEKSNAKISKSGFLLVDSGGTYYDGTTDITRTIACGKPTTQEKKYFSRVLKGHIDLAKATFLQGSTGCNVDILARGPLWDMNIDYQCGTGHGVGHVLSVHEGPHSIRWGNPRGGVMSTPFEPGMVVTDEPGVYIAHKIGVRIENELLVVKGQKNFYGQFLKFENLTLCPIDRDAIDPKELNDDELEYLNAYHANVYQKVARYLTKEEKAWLKKATAPIRK